MMTQIRRGDHCAKTGFGSENVIVLFNDAFLSHCLILRKHWDIDRHLCRNITGFNALKFNYGFMFPRPCLECKERKDNADKYEIISKIPHWPTERAPCLHRHTAPLLQRNEVIIYRAYVSNNVGPFYSQGGPFMSRQSVDVRKCYPEILILESYTDWYWLFSKCIYWLIIKECKWK